MIFDLENPYNSSLSIRICNKIYKIDIDPIEVIIANNRLNEPPILIRLL
jgi:hypothetical protein